MNGFSGLGRGPVNNQLDFGGDPDNCDQDPVFLGADHGLDPEI